MARRAPAYLVNYIPGLQRAGFSASGALNYLRGRSDLLSSADQAAAQAYGGPPGAIEQGMRRQTFLRAWGALAQAPSVRERIAALPLEHVPTRTEMVPLPAPRARGPQASVNLLVRDPESGAVTFARHDVVFREGLSFAELIERAASQYRSIRAGSTRGTPVGELVGGGFVDVIYERVPEDEEEPVF